MVETRDRRGQLSLDTDILVVGGGAAGVAAAFTAARAGARVLPLEKYGFCGGAAWSITTVAGGMRHASR
jgi:phytoene dehydrogenase-like protein